MIKLKSLLVERIDYQETAKQLVKQYKLRSKVTFGKVKGTNEADYDWVKDVINLKRNYPSVKEFIVSVLHEIDHAKMRQKMGWKKYEREYIQAGEDAEERGGDFHDDNEYEEQAESWARKEYSKKWKQKFK
jgi:hypothetical protein|tara:strand:- start:1548 stop:1940 length:393 start_codon:yes stop_codon:yes gene_type:complete